MIAFERQPQCATGEGDADPKEVVQKAPQEHSIVEQWERKQGPILHAPVATRFNHIVPPVIRPKITTTNSFDAMSSGITRASGGTIRSCARLGSGSQCTP